LACSAVQRGVACARTGQSMRRRATAARFIGFMELSIARVLGLPSRCGV
jgi:hypothetical protein